MEEVLLARLLSGKKAFDPRSKPHTYRSTVLGDVLVQVNGGPAFLPGIERLGELIGSEHSQRLLDHRLNALLKGQLTLLIVHFTSTSQSQHN